MAIPVGLLLGEKIPTVNHWLSSEEFFDSPGDYLFRLSIVNHDSQKIIAYQHISIFRVDLSTVCTFVLIEDIFRPAKWTFFGFKFRPVAHVINCALWRRRQEFLIFLSFNSKPDRKFNYLIYLISFEFNSLRKTRF